MPDLNAYFVAVLRFAPAHPRAILLIIAMMLALVAYLAAALIRRKGIVFTKRSYLRLMQIQALSFPFIVLSGAATIGPIVDIWRVTLSYALVFVALNVGFAVRIFQPVGPAKRFSIIPSDVVHNERLKLRAAWLNSASTMVMTAGIATPGAAFAFNIGDFQTKASLPLVAIGSGICLWFAVMLHVRATRTLGGLR